MYCDLGQGLVKWGRLVNSSEVVVYLPEYLVLRPAASWCFLKIWWVGALRHNAAEVEACIQNVSLRPGRPWRQMHRMLRMQLIIFADVVFTEIDIFHLFLYSIWFVQKIYTCLLDMHKLVR